MKKMLVMLMVIMLVGVIQADVLVYESFGDAPEANTTLAGYSGTTAETGLAGTWSVTGGSQNTVSRTTHEYVGIADGYAPDIVGGRQHWWEHNNQWNTNVATRSLSSSIDMTVDGTWYMSFSAMSGIKDFAAQMGLNDGTSELMWGQGYYGGSQGITAYYANIGSGAATNGNGTFVTGFNNTTKYETGFFVAKLVKSDSGITDALDVSIMYYDFKNLDAPTNVIDSGDPAVWTRIVNLTGVSSVFTTLELKLDGASSNYPSIDEVRIGQSWADVTIPEPATMLLLGLGSLLLRRKN